MTIAILPARLANQIAAGEVVERPASVIKELVENSLDAGATNINIEVDKGGVKRIRITDNGSGIVKDELTLALSRHATSKIKDLHDLEAIASLGFRGEALASISSVARLTLTSKPQAQATAWQASAQGRDMAVTIKPAAHPDGTTIEVVDLFFNTPARRKFLRTEKTEFTHIDEVIRRIALARFDVTFTLIHNSKLIRQYRAATTDAQNAKRVAMVCGQKFVDNAIEVNCQHDDMTFSGWIAKPSFARTQNDLCYSYVNGRMMRDKLINHAIRQAYADLLAPETYPAFVLFLTLDHRDVDVNVHPAKHEVRFHQSRYVHDFIYSVCHTALMENNQHDELNQTDAFRYAANQKQSAQSGASANPVQYARPDYVQPLKQISEHKINESMPNARGRANEYSSSPSINKTAIENYQKLLTPSVNNEQISHKETQVIASSSINDAFFVTVEQGGYGVFKQDNSLRLLSLFGLAYQVHLNKINQRWQPSDTKETIGLVSQPLLLPVALTLSQQQQNIATNFQAQLALAGVVFNINSNGKNKEKVQIRQFPSLLREQDVNTSFIRIINELIKEKNNDNTHHDTDEHLVKCAIAKAMIAREYSQEQANLLWQSAKKELSTQNVDKILLNSVPLDLTSQIKQLMFLNEH